jgi:YcxB-like protein
MTIKTKKFAIDKKTFINFSFRRRMTTKWFWFLIPAAVFLIGLILHFTGVYKNWWIPVVAVVGAALYALFWYAQFYAATEMEQNKQMFDKFSYEIDSRQILVKLNAKEGGMIKWDTIKSAEKEKDAFMLFTQEGQFLRFPFTVFNSENDVKLMETILRRKELLPTVAVA